MKREIFGAVFRYAMFVLLLAAQFLLTGSFWMLGILCLLILLPLISWGVNFHVRKKLRVTIRLASTGSRRAAADGRLEVENTSIFPVMKLYCRLQVSNGLTGEEETVVLPVTVGAKRRQSAEFLLQSGYCGGLTVFVEQIALMDYLGFLPVKARPDASGRMTVLPELFPGETALSWFSTSDADGTADRRGDDRAEVFQLRTYVPGDDVRQIHWKLSSKVGELLVKEPSQPLNRELLVFWDKRVCGTPAVMDTLAAAVSSVSQALLEAGETFVLCWTEETELEYRQIDHHDDLLAAIPALVKCRGDGQCPLPDMTGFSRILYFTGDGTSLSAPDERIIPLVCTETEQDIPEAMTFTPETCTQRLKRLEI